MDSHLHASTPHRTTRRAQASHPVFDSHDALQSIFLEKKSNTDLSSASLTSRNKRRDPPLRLPPPRPRGCGHERAAIPPLGAYSTSTSCPPHHGRPHINHQGWDLPLRQRRRSSRIRRSTIGCCEGRSGFGTWFVEEDSEAAGATQKRPHVNNHRDINAQVRGGAQRLLSACQQSDDLELLLKGSILSALLVGLNYLLLVVIFSVSHAVDMGI
jgi:hypothetical protein